MSPKVSAIVSTYNGDQFILGCVQDLIDQTLFQQNALEIIIIDSNSPGQEKELLKPLLKAHPQIKYIQTSERETLYAAWNRGIKEALAEFITNANVDDRHHRHGLETLLNTLIKNPHVDLVYADVYCTHQPNHKFELITTEKIYRYKPFVFTDVIFHYQFGCQPMWRRSIHEAIGGFDPLLKAAGDWDFNFRFNLSGKKAMHVQAPLGLFFDNPNSLSITNNVSSIEQTNIRQKYVNFENTLRLLSLDGYNLNSNKQILEAFTRLSEQSKKFTLPWEPDGIFSDQTLYNFFWAVIEELKKRPN